MHNLELYEKRITVKRTHTNTVIVNKNKHIYDFSMSKSTKSITPFQQWLRSGLDQPGKSVGGLAKYIGVAQPRVSEMLHGRRRPQARELSMIAEYMDQPLPPTFLPRGESVLRLPVVSVINAGKMVKELDPDDIRRTIRLCDMDQKGDWIALEVEGDSMDRISPPGSIILVNRNERRLVLNALYVIADDTGAASYKRYRNNPDRFEPVSTNPEHAAIYPNGEIRIIGRVRRSILDIM